MTEQQSFFKRFWEDLKRRHVVRVAIGYAIVAWAMVEGADILLPTFDAPDWLFRAIVAAAFLGFPITVILAWVFDISDKHVVVTDEGGFELPTWVKTLVAVPLIGLIGMAGWWVWDGYVSEKESSLRPTDLTDQVPIVAVMPIRNITGNPDNDWYSEGLANLVRDNLTRSRYLRVVSPMKWKAITGEATDEIEIAELAAGEGIGFILAGEMLITPGGITVTSRLTDTEGGVSLSSRQVENLTRETLLTASDPIAAQVKQGLNIPREEQIDIFAADFATSNLSAYESYVAGLGFYLNYQYDQAVQAFNAALQLAPDFSIARYRLAYIQAVKGETELAITNAEQALASGYLAERERLYIESAIALFKRDYEGATRGYEAILAEYPFEIEARALLADAYWGQYRADEAVRELERLVSEEPQNQVLWSTLGGYLLQMGEFQRAQPALKRFSDLAPDNANSYTLLGDSFRYQGQFDQAIEEYGKALAIDPKMREVAASLATIKYLQGDWEKAISEFSDITGNEELVVRERLDAMFPLASLMASRGDFEGAINTLESFADALREEQIREAMALSTRALLQLELGKEAAAGELVNSAIQLSPGVPTRYLFARGLIELKTGRYYQADETAAEIVGHALPEENPDRTEEKAAAYLQGMALMAQGQLEPALVKLHEARSLEGYAYAIYEMGLARAMMQLGRTSEAKAVLDESINPNLVDPRLDLEPERVLSILLDAEIKRKSGDLAAAGASAKQFLDRFDRSEPTHPATLLALEIAGEAGLVTTRKQKGSQLAALETKH